MDRKEKPSGLSQEEWFAWLSMSEAIMASFRIKKEEDPTLLEKKMCVVGDDQDRGSEWDVK